MADAGTSVTYSGLRVGGLDAGSFGMTALQTGIALDLLTPAPIGRARGTTPAGVAELRIADTHAGAVTLIAPTVATCGAFRLPKRKPVA
jgi:hypothetical protein